MVRLMLICVLVISLVGCSTMQAVQPVTASSVRSEIEVGDQVELSLKEGKALTLTVVRVSDDALFGTDAGGRKLSARFADIQALRVKRTSALKTGGVVIAALYVVGVAVIYMAGKAIGDSLKDRGDDN